MVRCGKEGHNARNKLCPALKDSQRPGSGAGAGSNDRFAPQTDLNAENSSSLRAPAGNQRYALAGGSGYKKDAFRNNDLGDSSVHDELSYHFNIAYIKDVDVPRHWLKMLHQFFMSPSHRRACTSPLRRLWQPNSTLPSSRPLAVFATLPLDLSSYVSA